MSCPFHKSSSKDNHSLEMIDLKKPSFGLYLSSLFKLLITKNLENVLDKGFKEIGEVFRVRHYVVMKGVSNLRFLFSGDPNIIQRAPISEPGLSSLATMDGPTQIEHKKFVMQAFKKKYLLKYAEQTMMDSLKFFAGLNGLLSIQPDMMRLSTVIILNSLLGLKQDNPEFKTFLNGYHEISKRGPQKKSQKSSYQRAMRRVPILWNQIDKLLSDRILNPSNDILTAFNQQRKDYPNITDKNAQDYIYMLAEFGQEDLGIILTFALSTLAYYQQYRAILISEIRSISNSNPSIEEITSLPFLKSYIQELERLFPPVPYFLRFVAKDIPVGESLLEKGTTVLGSIYHTHTDPEIFKNPMDFNPLRYSDEKTQYVLAFGGGYHMCPAKQYIYIQVALILFTLLKNYRLENTLVKPEITYRNSTGLKHHIKIRIYKL